MTRQRFHLCLLHGGVLPQSLIPDTPKESITPAPVIAGDRYSRVVFTSTEGENLWNLNAIKSMCNVDNLRVSKDGI